MKLSGESESTASKIMEMSSHTHTIPTKPMPGLVTCVGYQQHTAGHSDVPLTEDHTAHHGVGGGEAGARAVGDQM